MMTRSPSLRSHNLLLDSSIVDEYSWDFAFVSEAGNGGRHKVSCSVAAAVTGTQLLLQTHVPDYRRYSQQLNVKAPCAIRSLPGRSSTNFNHKFEFGLGSSQREGCRL
ncbi:hypothetical protein AB1N83_012615 [Pleurotus pulmonarius]